MQTVTINTYPKSTMALPTVIFLFTGSSNVARCLLHCSNFLSEVKFCYSFGVAKVSKSLTSNVCKLEMFGLILFFRMATPPPTYDEHIEYKAYSKEALI